MVTDPKLIEGAKQHGEEIYDVINRAVIKAKSVRRLAKKIGLCQSTVYRWFYGDCPSEMSILLLKEYLSERWP